LGAEVRHRRVIVRAKGGPEVIEVIEEEAPTPGPDDLRIRVEAAGVSAFDVMMRKTRLLPGVPDPPYTPGIDVVGVVDAVGAAVTGVEVGNRVASANFRTSSGASAELVCRPAAETVPVPDGVDAAEAVCVVVNYLTAHAMLHRGAELGAAERLLVQGAAGGVGTASLDLGRLAGAELYGTASARNLELVERFGATALDYRADDVVKRVREITDGGVDVVLDPVGGWRQLWGSYRCLHDTGRMVWFGVAATRDRGLWVILESFLMQTLLGLLPGKRRAIASPEADEGWTDTLPELLGHLAAKRLQPVIAARLPLEEARQAHEMLERGGHAGKVVLVP